MVPGTDPSLYSSQKDITDIHKLALDGTQNHPLELLVHCWLLICFSTILNQTETPWPMASSSRMIFQFGSFFGCVEQVVSLEEAMLWHSGEGEGISYMVSCVFHDCQSALRNYTIIKELGEGKFGQVKEVLRTGTKSLGSMEWTLHLVLHIVSRMDQKVNQIMESGSQSFLKVLSRMLGPGFVWHVSTMSGNKIHWEGVNGGEERGVNC